MLVYKDIHNSNRESIDFEDNYFEKQNKNEKEWLTPGSSYQNEHKSKGANIWIERQNTFCGTCQ